MLQYPVQPFTMQSLSELVDPKDVPGGQMDAQPRPIYDTQTYVSGTTDSLTFFLSPASGGDFLTNLEQGGQLPNPDFLVVQYITLDILGLEPGDADNLRDTYRILFGTGVLGAPFAQFRFKRKVYGPWPLSMMGGSGGPTGFTTRTSVEYANNGIPGQGGIWIGGAIVLPPLQAFSLTARWSAPVTLTADVQLRCSLVGTYYTNLS